jgi:hypothetical protein
MGRVALRGQCDSLLRARERLVHLALQEQHRREVAPHGPVLWGQARRLPRMRERVTQPPRALQHEAEVVVRIRVVRVNAQRPLVRAQGRVLELGAHVREQIGEVVVPLEPVGVQLQRPLPQRKLITLTSQWSCRDHECHTPQTRRALPRIDLAAARKSRSSRVPQNSSARAGHNAHTLPAPSLLALDKRWNR